MLSAWQEGGHTGRLGGTHLVGDRANRSSFGLRRFPGRETTRMAAVDFVLRFASQV